MPAFNPDALTSREREVLAFIRLGLTNEEIAERLGITLDGAKYHVSQILSKLRVATREEAAALAPERRRWWAAWPLAAKAAGAALVVVSVAGLGLLAWGVWETNSTAQQEPSELPRPSGEVSLNRDAALLQALSHLTSDIRGLHVEVSLTTREGVRRATSDTGYGPFDPPEDAPTWMVVFTGDLDPCAGGGSCGGFGAAIGSPFCHSVVVWFYDSSPFYGGTSGAEADTNVCRAGSTSEPLSRDEALVKAALNPSLRVYLGAPLEASDVEETTYGQAVDRLASRGWTAPLPAGTVEVAEANPVWLVTLKGPFMFVPPSPLAPPSPPGPSVRRLVCREVVSIIDAAAGTVIGSADRVTSGCYHPLAAPPPAQGPPDERPVAVSEGDAVELATQHAGISPGQLVTETSAEILALEQTGFTCACYPPHGGIKQPDSPVWVITLKGLLSEPLDPQALATPLPLEPECGEVIFVISAVTAMPYDSLFQHSAACA